MELCGIVECFDYAVFGLLAAFYLYLLLAFVRWSERVSFTCNLTQGKWEEAHPLLDHAQFLDCTENVGLSNGYDLHSEAGKSECSLGCDGVDSLQPSRDVAEQSLFNEPKVLGIEASPVESSSVVIDLGSGVIKAGLAGSMQVPSVIFPNIVGRPKYKRFGLANEELFVGDETLPPRRGILTLSYPMENGIVSNWDHMEKLLLHAFDQLRVEPTEQPIILVTSNHNPQTYEEILKLMFKRLHVTAVQIFGQSQLAIVATGSKTGLVVEIGDGVAQAVPIVEGNPVNHAIRTLGFAGHRLTKYLADQLNNSGKFSQTTTAQLEMVRDMKETLAYVAFDLEEEVAKAKNGPTVARMYELADGQLLELNQERFLCMEPLFSPSLIGFEGGGLPEIIHDAIRHCPNDVQNDLWSNIILVGGTTLCPRFGERLHKELTAAAGSTTTVQIVDLPERQFLAWMGGSLLASQTVDSAFWIKKEKYLETPKESTLAG